MSTAKTFLNLEISLFNNSHQKSPQCEQINSIVKRLNSTIPLIWIILGTITNGLSIFVFSRRSMRRNSTFTYLALMTLCDFIVIWFTSFRDLLVYKFNIFISGTLICRIHVFIFFLSCQLSSWLLTAANLDRLVYVVCYSHAKKWCNRAIAFKVAGIILTLLATMNLHFLIYVYTDKSDQVNASSINQFVYPRCHIPNGDYENFYKIYGWIDGFVFSFIPFIIMSVCNTALIIKVFSTKRNLNRKDMTKINAPQFITASSNPDELVPSEKRPLKTPAPENHAQPKQSIVSSTLKVKATDASSDRMRNMAITIIGCTLLFIIFTLPINIYIPIIHSSDTDSNRSSKCDDLLFSILNNMVNANHSINFFIYLLTNSKFRTEIKLFLGKKRAQLRRYADTATESCGFRIVCVQASEREYEANEQATGNNLRHFNKTVTNGNVLNNSVNEESVALKNHDKRWNKNQLENLSNSDDEYSINKKRSKSSANKLRKGKNVSKKQSSQQIGVLIVDGDTFITNNFSTSRELDSESRLSKNNVSPCLKTNENNNKIT